MGEKTYHLSEEYLGEKQGCNLYLLCVEPRHQEGFTLGTSKSPILEGINPDLVTHHANKTENLVPVI